MPLTKSKELSQKIDIGAPLSEMSVADFDEEDSIDDEFINIVKPLIQMSSSQSKASQGYYLSVFTIYLSPLQTTP